MYIFNISELTKYSYNIIYIYTIIFYYIFVLNEL